MTLKVKNSSFQRRACCCKSERVVSSTFVIHLFILSFCLSLSAMAVSPVFVLALLGILLGLLAAGLHQVPEGHIAVYYIGGKLADGDNDPGWHWSFPGLYTPVFVQITLQTDQVLHVGCGTSTGVMINFDRIEVVNVLDRKKAHATVKRFGANYDKTFIFDKVAFEINQFCSSNTLHEGGEKKTVLLLYSQLLLAP